MSSAKILIVEDEGLTAMELQRKLEYWGYEVPTFVFSGKEAIKKVQEINPDLVLMDIVLKGEIDGIDAAKEIIKSFPVPIIYLTAHGDEKTYERAKMTKHAAYILKPFNESELHRIIETAIYKGNLAKKLEKKGKLVDKSFEDSRGVIITDNAGYVHYINKEAANLTGWNKEKALNRSLNEIFTIEDVKTKSRLNPINLLMDNFKGYSTLISKDKTQKVIEYSLKPIIDDFEEFSGCTLIFKDITKIKLANELDFISESEKQFKSIYVQSSIPCGLFESDGNLLDANKPFLKLMGTDDISKIREFDLFNILNLSPHEKNELIDGKAVEYETKFDDTNLNIIVNPLYLDEDLVGGYLLQMQDITHEKIHEKSLKKNESEYKEVFDSVNDIFCEIDSKMNVLFCNKASEEFTDIPYQQTVGKSLFQLFPKIEDSKLAEIFNKALKNHETISMVKKCLIKDETRYLQIHVYPSINGISVIIRDVTEFKPKDEFEKNKEFYKSIIDHQKDIILRYSMDGSIIYANPICFQYFGGNLIGKDVSSLIPEDDRNGFKEHMKSIIKQKKFKNYQTRVFNLENEILVLEWTFDPVISSEKEFSEIQAVGRNVTRFKATEKILIQDYEKLKKEYDDELIIIKDNNESLKAEIDKFENIKYNLTSENLKLKNNIQQLTKKYDKQKNEVNIQVSQLEDINKSLTGKYSRLKEEYKEQIQKHELESNSSNKEIRDLKNQTDSIDKEFNIFKKHSESEIESYVNENESLRSEIMDLGHSRAKLKEKYSKIKEKHKIELQNSEKLIKQLNSKINEFKKNENLLKEELAEIESKFKEKLLALEKDNKTMDNNLSELKKQLKSLNNQNSILEERTKKQVAEFNIERDVFTTKLIEMKSLEKSLSKKIMEWELKYNKDLEKFQKNEQFLKEYILDLKDTNNSLLMKKKQLDNRLNLKLKKFNQDKKELKIDIKELKSENRHISGIIKDKNSLITEMNVQINDNLSNISSLMGIQSAYIIGELADKFKDNQNYINSIARIHQTLNESDDLRYVNLSEYVFNMVDELFLAYGVDKRILKTQITINDVFLDLKTAFNCGLIINELVLNTIKHAFSDKMEGLLEIEIKDYNDYLKMKISDNGVGIPKKFQDMESIGLKIVDTLVRQLDGTIQLNLNSGTEFKIKIPK